MSVHTETLLDVTDRSKRLVQHGAVLGGIVLLAAASAALGDLRVSLGLIGAGLVLFAVTAAVSQDWSVSHRGHQIRYHNNPLLGEKLFIDDKLVAKGKIGIRSEMLATIAGTDGTTDEILASSVAGFLTFRCRIVARRARAATDPDARHVPDDELLAEVRRRGLA